MKLMRDSGDLGKYIVIDLRRLPFVPRDAAELARAIAMAPEAVRFGRPGDPDEFFVMMLKDRNSQLALIGYADAAAIVDPELSMSVRRLARRAGPASPFCKDPD